MLKKIKEFFFGSKNVLPAKASLLLVSVLVLSGFLFSAGTALADVPVPIITYSLNGDSNSITVNPITQPVLLGFTASESIENWVSVKVQKTDEPTRYRIFSPIISCDNSDQCEKTWLGDISYPSDDKTLVDGIYNVIVHIEKTTDPTYDLILTSPYTITVDTAPAISSPAITDISPNTGITLGAMPVTITGTEFASGATVTIGGNPASGVVVASSTEITAHTPIGVAGSADVVVTNPDTGTVTSIGGYTYFAPLPVTLTSIVITTPPTKTVYTVGETFLDLAGLVVIGTYSDNSTTSEQIDIPDVSGFNSSAPVTGQVLTVTLSGRTATFTIDVVAMPVTLTEPVVEPMRSGSRPTGYVLGWGPNGRMGQVLGVSIDSAQEKARIHRLVVLRHRLVILRRRLRNLQHPPKTVQ
ncbi:MAG: IPT/TIG domain-containing protein [Candidatus Vogelbacteria bacterium]|nr:IPT/TIG domain-containing protein [Candidatus Vogelbacteria bacterium]